MYITVLVGVADCIICLQLVVSMVDEQAALHTLSVTFVCSHGFLLVPSVPQSKLRPLIACSTATGKKVLMV